MGEAKTMNGLKAELKNILGAQKFEVKKNEEIYLNVPEDEFLRIIGVLYEKKFALVSVCAIENFEGKKGITLAYVFEKRMYPDFLIIYRTIKKEATSIATIFPSACWYEREIMDGFGIMFVGSYDQRRLFLHESYPSDFHPLQKSFKNGHIVPRKDISSAEEYPFKEVHGEGVYHIPVGPVHAGIIEPGHFRFSVIGETIFNLEVRMFWKHRGIEKLAENKYPEEVVRFAEAISGDETVANALGYCQAVEKISRSKVPIRAESLRAIFAEMERIYSLLGDLAGMIIDVAYPAGASPFFILREEILRWNEKLSGSRFYKGILKIGGLQRDVENNIIKRLVPFLHTFSVRLKRAVSQSLSFSGIIDRFETTGIVPTELVGLLNLSGPLARASGVPADVRVDHPYGVYTVLHPHMVIMNQGDVLARFKVKTATIEDSVRIIHHLIKELSRGEICVKYIPHDGHALSMVESARGQNLHFVDIQRGVINRYKIRTASFCNWQAIEHAVIGNIVPDFPLINKSMNLSYAGTDV